MSNVTYRVDKFESTRITPSMFENKKSYEYFMIGYQAAQDLQMLKNLGYIILDADGVPFPKSEEWCVSFDEHKGVLSMPRVGLYSKGSMSMWIGATMGLKPDTVFVYKKELKAFEKITHFMPKEVTKFKLRPLA